MNHRQRILSGIQPSGALHIGNYLGAIKNWVALQDEGQHECLFCIVDLHAITVWQDPAELRHQSRMVAASYLACGIDPGRCVLFVQSMVPGHAQLAWVLSCVARLGWLNRMTQFKEKSGKDRENVSLGLFAYPALMAADILLYKATHVPVGDDQKQHIELARDTAQKFNLDFDAPDFFPLPEPLIMGPGARIMSLRDGTRKMGKSDPSDYSRIHLTDTIDEIATKIRKAKTDPEPLPLSVDGFSGRPEAENLVAIYAAFNGTAPEAVLLDFGGHSFSHFKSALADLLVTRLGPIAGEIGRLMSDPGTLDRILLAGAEQAEALARPVIEAVYERVGFFRPLG